MVATARIAAPKTSFRRIRQVALMSTLSSTWYLDRIRFMRCSTQLPSVSNTNRHTDRHTTLRHDVCTIDRGKAG